VDRQKTKLSFGISFQIFIEKLFLALAPWRVRARDQPGNVGEPQRLARGKAQQFAPFDNQSPPALVAVLATENFFQHIRVGHPAARAARISRILFAVLILDCLSLRTSQESKKPAEK
jgi:hypothetical protein